MMKMFKFEEPSSYNEEAFSKVKEMAKRNRSHIKAFFKELVDINI